MTACSTEPSSKCNFYFTPVLTFVDMINANVKPEVIKIPHAVLLLNGQIRENEGSVSSMLTMINNACFSRGHYNSFRNSGLPQLLMGKRKT